MHIHQQQQQTPACWFQRLLVPSSSGTEQLKQNQKCHDKIEGQTCLRPTADSRLDHKLKKTSISSPLSMRMTMMLRLSVIVAFLFVSVNAFQTAPRIRKVGSRPRSLYALDPKKTVVAPISSTESSLDLLLVVENAVGSFDLESSSQNDDWVGGVAWRGVVAKTLQWFCTCITDLMSS